MSAHTATVSFRPFQTDHARVSEPALERMRRLLLGIAVAVAALAIASALADVLLLLFAAVLLAAVLHGAAERIGRLLHVRGSVALAAILLIATLVVALSVFFRGPSIVAEVLRIGAQIGGEGEKLRRSLSGEPWAEHLVARGEAYLSGSHWVGMVSGFASGTLGVLGSLLVLVVAGLYFAVAPDLYVDGTIRLVPFGYRPRARAIMAALGSTLRWWFIGQAIDMAVIGVLTGVGLLLLGVKLALTLAAIAALCNFVPYIGAICGAVPAVLVALGQGPREAAAVALLFLAVQTLEGNVTAPLIQRRTVALPPVLTIFSQTVLGTLFGPLGLILATPLTAAATVLVRTIYVEDVLGDR